MALLDEKLLIEKGGSVAENVSRSLVMALPESGEDAIHVIAKQEGVRGIGAEAGMWVMSKAVELPTEKVDSFVMRLSAMLEINASVIFPKFVHREDGLKMSLGDRQNSRVRFVIRGTTRDEVQGDWYFVDCPSMDDGGSKTIREMERLGLSTLMTQRNATPQSVPWINEHASSIDKWHDGIEPPTIVVFIAEKGDVHGDEELIELLAHDPGIAAFLSISRDELGGGVTKLDLDIQVGHVSYDKDGIQTTLDEAIKRISAREVAIDHRAGKRQRHLTANMELQLEVGSRRKGIDRYKKLIEHERKRVGQLEEAMFDPKYPGFFEFAREVDLLMFVAYEDIPRDQDEIIRGVLDLINEKLSFGKGERVTELFFAALASELLAMGSPAIMVKPRSSDRIEMAPTGSAPFEPFTQLMKLILAKVDARVVNRPNYLNEVEENRRINTLTDLVIEYQRVFRSSIGEAKTGAGTITQTAKKLGWLRQAVVNIVAKNFARATGAVLNPHHQISWNPKPVLGQSFETALSGDVFTAMQRDGGELGWKTDMRGLDAFFVTASYLTKMDVGSFEIFLNDNPSISTGRGIGRRQVDISGAKKLWGEYKVAIQNSPLQIEGLPIPQKFWDIYSGAATDFGKYTDLRKSAGSFLLAVSKWMKTEESGSEGSRLRETFCVLMEKMGSWRLATAQYYWLTAILAVYARVNNPAGKIWNKDDSGSFYENNMFNLQSLIREWRLRSEKHLADISTVMVNAVSSDANMTRYTNSIYNNGW